MKKTFSLVSLLTITAFSSICSAQEPISPLMQMLITNGRDIAMGAVGLIEAGGNKAQEWLEKRAEANRKNRLKLEQIIANPNSYTEAEVVNAKKNLADLEEEDKQNRQKLQGMQDEALRIVQDSARAGLDIGKDFAIAQIEGAQKLKELAVQGGIAKQQAVAEAQIAADAGLAKFREGLNFLQDKQKMTTVVGAIGAAAFLFFIAKYGVALVSDAIRHYYRNPSLAQETSLPTFQEYLWELKNGKKILSSSIKDVILEKTLEERVAVVAHSVQEAASTGNYLPNVLFYGPPGTGKTMIAQRIARSSGMHYIYFAASALEQFTIEEALIKLTELFEFAKKSDQKLMIIIDEAENLFADRTKGLPEKTAKMLTHLLTYTGTESRDYMVVLLTNLPSLLDSAVLSRMDQQIEIAPPALEQRIGILNKYISDLLIKNKAEEIELSWVGKVGSWFTSAPKAANPIKIEKDALSQEIVASIAARLDGFVGRDISKLVLGLQARVNASKDKVVTPAMIETVVAEKIAQHKAIKEGFKKA